MATQRYRVISTPHGWPDSLPFRLGVPGGTEDYGVGEVFEHEFDSVDDELANLESGLLEIVPRKYKVVGDTAIYETPPDGEFEAALNKFEEAHLIDAGHIARADSTPTTAKRKPKEAK